MLSSVEDTLLLEQFEDVGDNQTRFVLAESHGTEVAFEAVQSGLLLLLLIHSALPLLGPLELSVQN